MIFRNKKVGMIEATEFQIRKWFPNVRIDVLDNVISSITQHIRTSDAFKKRTSFSLRLDQHPPRWLKVIYDREHFDYSHAISSPKQIHLDFNEMTVYSNVHPEEPKIIYDGSRKKVPC